MYTALSYMVPGPEPNIIRVYPSSIEYTRPSVILGCMELHLASGYRWIVQIPNNTPGTTLVPHQVPATYKVWREIP